VGRRVFITIYNNITIAIIITSKIDATPLAVCVDQNPRLCLLNLVHICAWGINIILW
jgi:hypothetical protein